MKPTLTFTAEDHLRIWSDLVKLRVALADLERAGEDPVIHLSYITEKLEAILENRAVWHELVEREYKRLMKEHIFG